jgi:hypothetical protein
VLETAFKFGSCWLERAQQEGGVLETATFQKLIGGVKRALCMSRRAS